MGIIFAMCLQRELTMFSFYIFLFDISILFQ